MFTSLFVVVVIVVVVVLAFGIIRLFVYGRNDNGLKRNDEMYNGKIIRYTQNGHMTR